MDNKIKRYFIYGIRFISSSNKTAVVKELLSEIQKKGVITGIKSLLHRKSHGGDEASVYNDNIELSIKDYSKHKKIALPHVLNPRVSIIIPTYNHLDYTYNCIHSIYENNEFKDYEIIIADDRSSEPVHLLKENFENIVLISNETNLGFLRNCNNAATKARGEYIVFLNNDTQVQRNWLGELLFIFEHDARAGIVGSKLVYPDGSLQEAGGIIWQNGGAYNYGNTDNPEHPQYNYVKETDYISGASIMIKKSLWQEIGGFDEWYLPAYCEDSDLCFKVREKGYKVIYQPFSVVVHFEGISHGTDLDKGIKQHQLINQKKFRERWQDELKLKSKPFENVFSERDRTKGKKHVLVVDHYLPEIDKDAGSRTISNFIDTLLDLGYSVKFLGENENASPQYKKQFQEKGVEVLYGSQFSFSKQRWRHYLMAHLRLFDAILLSRSSVCTPIIDFLRRSKYKGNIIYYGHDLGFRRVENEARLNGDELLLKEAKRIKEQEDYMYKRADNAFFISYEEMEYLSTYIKTPLHYIPPYFFDVAPDTVPYKDRSGILFIGGFRHTPNQSAMKWFVEEVYEPLSKQGIPLTIAGSEMPEFIFEYKKRFTLLTVLPDVSVGELDNLYQATKIAIVPLTNGAGVKGKVIEAMAKGVPVVGTDVAFEGMPKGEDFIYKGANTPNEIRNRILKVYTDENLWKELSDFGKRYVLNNFSKENMKRVFKDLIG